MVILIVTGVVTAFIAPFDQWNLMTLFNNDELVFFIYALAILFVILLCALLDNMIRVNIEREQYKLLTDLMELKTEGVYLRNRIILELKNPSNFNPLRISKAYDAWYERTLSKYKEINPVRAENCKTLDVYPRHKYPNNYPDDFRKLLDIIREKTKRLSEDIETMLKDMRK